VPYNDPQLLRLDRVLTGFSVGYQNADLVATDLFPTVSVANQSDKYNIFTRGNAWRSDWDSVRGPGGKANEIPPRTLSRDSYFAVEHALMDVVPVEETQAARAGDVDRDPLRESTEEITSMLLMEREQKAVTIATSTTLYNASNTTTLSGTAQFSDYTNSTPITKIKTGRDRIYSQLFQFPTVAVMGYQVASILEDHPNIIERIKYSQRGVSTDEIIAQVLGMPRFRRAGAGKLTNAVGQAETVGYMWGKDVVLAYVPANPGKRVASYGYEFAWPWPEGIMPTERWYDDDYKSDKVRVSRRYDMKLITVDSSNKSLAGYLIKDAVA
jgi:hypothetical protein